MEDLTLQGINAAPYQGREYNLKLANGEKLYGVTVQGMNSWNVGATPVNVQISLNVPVSGGGTKLRNILLSTIVGGLE